MERIRATAGTALLASALAAACASGGTSRAPAGAEPAAAAPADTAPPTSADVPLVADVPVYEPVRPPDDYAAAVAAGTRSEIGRPGPSYWQQRVDYSIRATLHPSSASLTGSETVRYANHSPDTLRSLVLHLYQNVFSDGVERNRTVRLTGGIRLNRVAAQGRTLSELGPDQLRGAGRQGPPPGYVVNGTLARVFLPRPLPPGGTAELQLDWNFRVPGSDAFRMGRIGNEVFSIAQWYPQVATYDDVRGQDLTPYLGDGEFYLEYGAFDVELEVPAGWLVTATGTLRNPGDVLPADAAARLRAAVASDTVLRVAEASGAGGEEGARAGAGGAGGEEGPATRVWRFRADSVRDFAFATSSRYVWDAVGAEVGGDVGRARIDALYDPSVEHWSEAARYSKHAVEFFSDYIFPYPYPHASAAQGHVGGMEYPMVVFIGRSRPGRPLYSVLAHEFSHEWFPMVVGSHEADYAWMDEGLTSFNESLARADFFGEESGRVQDMQRYLVAAQNDLEAPIMWPTDYVPDPFGRVVAAYTKPATLLHALRGVLGEETFDAAYRTYARAWAYRHPMPWDFFASMETEVGRDLDWFWRPWFFRTETLDQAVTAVAPVEGGVRVTVENLGGAVMPVRLEVTTSSGAHRVTWPVDVWAGRREVTRTVEVPGRVERVTLDPEQHFPDVDRSNNARTAGRP